MSCAGAGSISGGAACPADRFFPLTFVATQLCRIRQTMHSLGHHFVEFDKILLETRAYGEYQGGVIKMLIFSLEWGCYGVPMGLLWGCYGVAIGLL